MGEYAEQMAAHLASGAVRYCETVVHGLENAPAALGEPTGSTALLRCRCGSLRINLAFTMASASSASKSETPSGTDVRMA